MQIRVVAPRAGQEDPARPYGLVEGPLQQRNDPRSGTQQVDQRDAPLERLADLGVCVGVERARGVQPLNQRPRLVLADGEEIERRSWVIP